MCEESLSEVESGNDSFSNDEPKRFEQDSDSSQSESDEIWNGVLPEMLSRDIESGPPLPEAQHGTTELQKVNSLVFWIVYFLLIWQAACHLSDNGLAWLLRFLVTWLKALGMEISSEVFEKLILAFPGSLYLMRQFLNLDRDNFNKFVVCPKCTKPYKYDSCLEIVNNQQVARKCCNTYYSRRRKHVCNASLVTN